MKLELEKVQDYPELRKDTTNGAVINVDRDAYYLHKMRKKKMREQETRLDNVEKSVQRLESMMEQLLDKLGK